MSPFPVWSKAASLPARRLIVFLLAVISAAGRGALQIEVLRGQGAINNALRGGATSPVVLVLDPEGLPVPSALVVFSPPAEGATVTFGGPDAAAAVITDESGVAVAPRTRPAGANGPLEIRVNASHSALLGYAVILQMNLGLGVSNHGEPELSVIRLPDVVGVHASNPRESTVLVRIEDSLGRAVASAEVQFELHKLSDGGKAQRLWARAVISSPNGEAALIVSRPTGHAKFELMVRAESGGRRATSYFRLN